MSLARLWQRQGKRDSRPQSPGPIYGWFTEGFDTADLQEAKALLEELVMITARHWLLRSNKRVNGGGCRHPERRW